MNPPVQLASLEFVGEPFPLLKISRSCEHSDKVQHGIGQGDIHEHIHTLIDQTDQDQQDDRLASDGIGADQTIRAVCIRGTEARHLNVRSGAAGFLVISTGYLSGGVPLWWEQTVFRGDAYAFQNRLGPIQTARPAAGTLLDIGSQTDLD